MVVLVLVLQMLLMLLMAHVILHPRLLLVVPLRCASLRSQVEQCQLMRPKLDGLSVSTANIIIHPLPLPLSPLLLPPLLQLLLPLLPLLLLLVLGTTHFSTIIIPCVVHTASNTPLLLPRPLTPRDLTARSLSTDAARYSHTDGYY
jgi:hypothetical protein